MKRTKPTLVLALTLSILITTCLLSSPAVEAGTRIMFRPGILSAGVLGDNTYIFSVSLIDNLGDNYHFTTTGQRLIDVPENRQIDSIYVDVKLNDNYADTGSEAEDRTRITLTITNGADTTVFENVVTGPSDDIFQIHDYYMISRLVTTTIFLSEGTWTVYADYEVFARE